MGNSHQAKRYPSSVSAPIYPIKRAERVLKGNKGIFLTLWTLWTFWTLRTLLDSYHKK